MHVFLPALPFSTTTLAQVPRSKPIKLISKGNPILSDSSWDSANPEFPSGEYSPPRRPTPPAPTGGSTRKLQSCTRCSPGLLPGPHTQHMLSGAETTCLLLGWLSPTLLPGPTSTLTRPARSSPTTTTPTLEPSSSMMKNKFLVYHTRGR
ncbi:conserved hypothetical protein [Aspergillus fumigatus A1163]|uniref:Uncharacterized protein n=1 Tax=Aspergillus fumigatus (strain CBS 144.89 / FGSC A1163 / CEA10) TaxID=451804 RepID=B0XW01_ASPFC|nr:conserved hypothetical protein [Aspergillus fumigatus A1163]